MYDLYELSIVSRVLKFPREPIARFIFAGGADAQKIGTLGRVVYRDLFDVGQFLQCAPNTRGTVAGSRHAEHLK